MARFNSLLGRSKFPVPTRREFRHNSFKLLPNFEPLAGRGRPREQNSRYSLANQNDILVRPAVILPLCGWPILM
jgi:hypothetical protein